MPEAVKDKNFIQPREYYEVRADDWKGLSHDRGHSQGLSGRLGQSTTLLFILWLDI
jgi:hypothetical protein